MTDTEGSDSVMDWSSIALLLAERVDRPLVLLDHTNHICLWNNAVEKLLGWRRHEAEGYSWLERCVAPEYRAESERWLEQAQRGAVNRYEGEVSTKAGDSLLVELETSVVGRDHQRGLLVAVRSASPVERAQQTTQWLTYEISTALATFGRLARVSGSGKGALVEQQRPCYAALYERADACDDCPVLRSPADAWPRVTIRSRAGDDAAYEVTTAELIAPHRARLSVQTVADATLKAIRDTRVRTLAEGASLTERERAVMQHLIEGRSLDEVAKALGMSPRTAKFHQANLLQKLGASSRGDLLRLVSL